LQYLYHTTKSGGKGTCCSLSYLILNESQDFILHGFPAGFAEMNAHPVGGGADSLGKGSILALRPLLFGCCPLH
jgi:hypothetical protein